MKYFKRFGLLVVMLFMILFVTGCKNKEHVEGSLEDIMTKIYKDIPEDNLPMMLENKKVTDENVEYYLGKKGIEYKEALASESGVGSIAYSVVLVRTKENANIEEIKRQIKDNVNPRKWICVEVPKDKVIVENKGDLIILVMVEDKDNRDAIMKGFNSL